MPLGSNQSGRMAHLSLQQKVTEEGMERNWGFLPHKAGSKSLKRARRGYWWKYSSIAVYTSTFWRCRCHGRPPKTAAAVKWAEAAYKTCSWVLWPALWSLEDRESQKPGIQLYTVRLWSDGDWVLGFLSCNKKACKLFLYRSPQLRVWNFKEISEFWRVFGVLERF